MRRPTNRLALTGCNDNIFGDCLCFLDLDDDGLLQYLFGTENFISANKYMNMFKLSVV